jgi:hypothetical protein
MGWAVVGRLSVSRRVSMTTGCGSDRRVFVDAPDPAAAPARGAATATRARTSAGTVRRVTGAGSRTRGRRPQRVLPPLAAVVPAIHGLDHLTGVALLWHWREPGELRDDDVHPAAGSTAHHAQAPLGTGRNA